MKMYQRSVGRWISPSVPFVESTCVLHPKEAKNQDGPAYLTIIIMIFLVWHVQMQGFQKSEVRTGIIPHFLRREKMQVL